MITGTRGTCAPGELSNASYVPEATFLAAVDATGPVSGLALRVVVSSSGRMYGLGRHPKRGLQDRLAGTYLVPW